MARAATTSRELSVPQVFPPGTTVELFRRSDLSENFRGLPGEGPSRGAKAVTSAKVDARGRIRFVRVPKGERLVAIGEAENGDGEKTVLSVQMGAQE